MLVEVRSLDVVIGTSTLVSQLSFVAGSGSSIAILGRSGCGKTSLLRTLVGFLPASSGSVLVSGLPPQENFGTGAIEYLHQDPCIWPHLSVMAHLKLAYRLLRREPSSQEIDEVLALLRLEGASDFYPFQLSGGMKTRLALARAFISRPKLLFADEPFSGLDTLSRHDMNMHLEMLRVKMRCTTIWVTHDLFEALTFAATIIVFSNAYLGRVEIIKNVPARMLDQECELSVDKKVLRDNILSLMS